ncbi:16S rRNA (guanine(966)-N(2))-methyltransferase RsmD [Crenobacter caeni]|uniref:16S rRNA (Guanine(966)-N(2))-methyltransferase RsmD n=1 Tax=Crenobacter caeni TaxID=2705474 RepID=A0A6B2KNC1_9NEIS|nr:16S rRNA (guanine(966)-N(2))-methyltransferase RsmD [Crenobacter caeni]NDV11489.1 16S rRNA (guanine(966)-N(2))-methyltransferase RsmD [Crenobacter caeni]
MGEYRNKVRVIAGKYRRRQLAFPDVDGLRPTPDRVRTTLFNWLGAELDGLVCLDLFAGSGALGFEAASRGARRVVMVERDRSALTLLKDNRRMLGADEIDVVSGDALAYLRGARERFDLVFLDPPFGLDLLPALLPLLPGLLAPGARVYLEAARLPDLAGWRVLKQGSAGAVRYALVEADVAEPA